MLFKKKKDEKNQMVVKKENGDEEVKQINKASHRLWKLIGIIASIILIILVVGAVIDIFDFFYSKYDPEVPSSIYWYYIAFGVLALVIVLILLLVIRPIFVALATPCFTLDVNSEKSKHRVSRTNYRKLKRVALNIIKTNKNVSEESKEAIRKAMHSHKELNEALKKVYDTEILKDINRLISIKSTEVLLATAISQNSKFDSLTVILVNIRMIMQIVVRCGYHPSYAQLGKLMWKVLRNALIAYTIQSLHLEDIVVGGINKLTKGLLSSIPALGEITAGIAQGSANALLTLRIGILTRKYLYEEYNIQQYLTNPEEANKEILESALRESNDEIDVVINECKQRKEKEA